MKTVTSMMIIGGLAAAAGVHAQDAMGMDDASMGGTAYETMTTSSTDTVNGVTTNVQTQYVSTTTVAPVDGVIGDAPATPAITADSSVKVKLKDGTIIDVPDSADAPWNKDSRLNGYDRFTFDPDSGAFVAGMGDDKFASNWDENGNRVAKPVAKPAPKAVVKKVKAKKVVTKTAPAVEATDAAPAEPEAAADAVMPDTTGATVTETVSQTVTETPAGKTTTTAVTVTSSSTPAADTE